MGFIEGTNNTLRVPLLHGKSCKPQCNLGFKPVGTRSCYAGVLHNTFECIPMTCDASRIPLHGNVGNCSANIQPGSTCQPECNEGYENKFKGKRSCLGGVYEDTFSCHAKSCLNPSIGHPPQYGTLGSCEAYVKEKTQNIKYRLLTADNESSDDTGNNGMLNKSKFENEYELPSTSFLEDSTSLSEGAGLVFVELPHRTACTPVCNPGFRGLGTRSCWEGKLSDTFQCQPMLCDASPVPLHGRLGNCTSSLWPGSTCQPICDEGYENIMNGFRSCIDGEYQDTFRCTGKPCHDPALQIPPENGSLGTCGRGSTNPNGTNLTIIPLAHGETCTPQCDLGFSSNTGTRSCYEGVLHDTFFCHPDGCDASQIPAHGGPGNCTSSLSSGEICYPVCDEGYTAVLPTISLKAELGSETDHVSEKLTPDGESISYDKSQHVHKLWNASVVAFRSCHAGRLKDHFVCSPNVCENASWFQDRSDWSPRYIGLGHRSAGNCPERLPSGYHCTLECEVGLEPFGLRVCHAGTLVDTFECRIPYSTVIAGIGSGIAVCMLLFGCIFLCRKTGCCHGYGNSCSLGSSDLPRRTVVAPRHVPSEASRIIHQSDKASKQFKSKIETGMTQHKQNTQQRLSDRRQSEMQSRAAQKKEALELNARNIAAAEKARKAAEAQEAKKVAEAEEARELAKAMNIKNAKEKLLVAINKKDIQILSLVIDDLNNEADYIMAALSGEMSEAKRLVSALEAELDAAKKQEILKSRVKAAQIDLAAVMNNAKDSAGLAEARRHVHVLEEDKDLSREMASEIENAKSIITKNSNSLQDAILKEVSDAMADRSNSQQYQRLKGAIEALDAFEPSLDNPSNAGLIISARTMLNELYEVYKLKLLLEQLDNRAIAKLKSMVKPVEDIHNIVKAMLLLLGEDARDLRDWKSCKGNISRMGKQSLKRRIDDFRIEMCTNKVTKQVKRLLVSVHLDRVEEISPTVAIFYAFVQGALALDDKLDAKKAAVDSKDPSPPPIPPPPPPGKPAGGGFSN